MNNVVKHHFARAAELLEVARRLADEFPADAISRSYYAMFHAATAVLMEKGIERRSHKGLIAAFSEFLVKPGLLDKRFHAMLRRAFDERSESDYFPEPQESSDHAIELLKEAEEFVAECRKFSARQ